MNTDWNNKTARIPQLQELYQRLARFTTVEAIRPHVRSSSPKHFELPLQYPWRFVGPIRGHPWSKLLPS
jgi:hypothetical protein